MYSLGCILGELINNKPIFPGTSTLNQLDRIMQVSGRPSQQDIEAIQSSLATTILDSLPPTKQRPFREVFPNATPNALDLLKKLLIFNPNKRIDVFEALQHPYVAQFHNVEDEPICPREIRIPIDDNIKYSVKDYRD